MKQLQAILDYMKKVKSSITTVHTHSTMGGVNQRPKEMGEVGHVWQNVASGCLCGPKVMELFIKLQK